MNEEITYFSVCSNCGEMFVLKKYHTPWYFKRRINVFCSKKCSDEFKKMIYIGICDNCFDGFILKTYRRRKNEKGSAGAHIKDRYERSEHIFCSKKCSDEFKKGKPSKAGELLKIWKKANPELVKEISKVASKKSYETNRKNNMWQSKEFKKKISQKNKINTKKYYALKEHRQQQSKRIKKSWEKNKCIYNYFKGRMFEKDHKLTDFDEEIIRTRVRLFEIQQKEINHERQIDGN